MGSLAGKRVLVMLGARTEAFYSYQGLAICRAIAALGGTAVHYSTPHVSEFTKKVPEHELLDAIKAHQITDIYTVNVPAGLALPSVTADPGFLWHESIQDLYDARLETPQRPWERRWNWVRRWGDPVLLPATDFGKFLSDTSDGYDFDVCFVGYLPTDPLVFRNTDPRLTIKANIVYEELLRLWGEDGDQVDLRSDADAVEAMVSRAERSSDTYIAEECRVGFNHYIAGSGVRFYQRVAMMTKVVDICKRRGWRLAISGEGWNNLPEFSPYAIGHCIAGEMMAHLGVRSVVNLNCNGETIFHNRVLEIYAAGGFCMSWVPGLHDDEGMNHARFTLGNIEERLDYWLSHEHERLAEVARVGELVRRDHTFEKRMTEMLA